MKDNEDISQRRDADDGDSAVLPAEQLVPEEEDENDEEAGGADIDLIEREIGLLESQLQDMRDRYVRAVADLDNARKRARREIREAQHRTAAGILMDVLTIVDSFELALGSAGDVEDAPPQTKAVCEGVTLIYRQIMDMLSRRGVKPIQAVGERFDPDRHEAVTRVPAGSAQEEGVVALELRKGYFFGDQVLRPSRVGVTVHAPHTD